MTRKNLFLALSFSVVVFIFCACDKIKLVDVQPVTCYPQEEVCNGKDDNCDGQIDEGLDIECATACGKGVIACVNGKYQPCNARQPGPVDIPCNGIDDDCDGTVDNIDVQPCYPGNVQHDLAHPYSECRFGIKTVKCLSNGAPVVSCTGWVGPTAEVCNGKDDDCNGEIDDGLPVTPLDIVLVLDESCSMADDIVQLINSTESWAKKYESRANLRLSLVVAPSNDVALDGEVTRVQNIGSVNDFLAVLKTQVSGDTWSEPTIDAVFMISSPTNPLGLNWTPGSKRTIIVFSDEEPQSNQFPPVTEQEAIDEAKNNDVLVYVFTNDVYLPTWGKWNSQVFSPPTSVEKELDKIISSNSCQ